MSMLLNSFWGVLLPDLKVASVTLIPVASTTAYVSSTYNDLLADNTTPAAVVYEKLSGGTGLWVRAGLSCRMADTSRNVILGINDGTTDYDIACGLSNRIGIGKWIASERILTGLAAGIYIFKLRVKIESTGATLHFANSNSAYLTVAEVP